MKKLQRIGLKVVQQGKTNWTTTSTVASEIILPEELFSVEESLGMLAGCYEGEPNKRGDLKLTSLFLD